MRPSLAGLDRRQAIERLTALWALNEAGLGGLIHALRVPFTGILVGSTAVVLMTLLAFFAERPARELLKATVVVLLVKAAASPHTPLPAYVAVAFQGVAAALVFGGVRSIRLGGLLLGLLALWQGAAQKLLTMTILYGKSLWEAVDAVGHWLLDKLGAAEGGPTPTGWFLFFYLGYYTLAGLATGWLAGSIPAEIARELERPPPAEEPVTEVVPPLPSGGRKRWWRRTPFKTGVVLGLLLLVLVWRQPGGAGWAKGLRVFARAGAVIGLWMLVARPLGAALLRRFRRREEPVYGREVARTLEELPALRRQAVAAWRHGRRVKGPRRWRRFLVELIVRALSGVDKEDTV
ncbi:MAG: hypothetical protein GX803_04290 [Lentisphaerae bacterium]|jgi:hypothetical protein|nr:hypothetical protein [Lentisphaerota bacterium]